MWRHAPSAIGLALFVCVSAVTRINAQFGVNAVSQNCLHLGWGSHTDSKVRGIAAASDNAQGMGVEADVIVLQEVMPKGGADGTAAIAERMSPGTYQTTVSPAYGKGSYKEFYGFIVKAIYTMGGVVGNPANNSGSFARPPAGVTVTVAGQQFWLINYHAVFGKNAGIRQAEVQQVPTVIAGFVGVTNIQVLMGGDWNLPTDDTAFNGFGAYGRGPNEITSLNPQGIPSSRYDHFVWQLNSQPTNLQILDPIITTQEWRANVSDHLGITCQM